MNNFAKRTVFGALFGAVLIVSLLFYTALFPAVAIIAIYFMMSEFYGISMGESYPLARKLAIFSAELLFALMFVVYQFGVPVKWLSLSALPLFAAMISVLFDREREQLYQFPYIFTGLLYIGIPSALLPLVVFKDGEFNGWLLMCFFIIIWCSDIGAYCLGTLLGQKPDSKKLAPTISPKKSWWGVWSGLVFAMGAAVGLRALGWLDLPFWHTLVFGALVSAAGVCGDLFESVWKRYFHVKDSGNVIPGHGGMLDRFDSSLFAIPIGTVYLAIFNLL